MPRNGAHKACSTLHSSVVTNLLYSLRIISPQSAIFTAIEKQHTVLSQNEISSDSYIGAYEEVPSFCNRTCLLFIVV